jgi:hypothetical protein
LNLPRSSGNDAIPTSLMVFESFAWNADRPILLPHGATQVDLRIHIFIPLILIADHTGPSIESALVLVLIPISV